MVMFANGLASAATLQVQSAAGGVVLGGNGGAATLNLGNANGLGVGTVATNVARSTLSNGAVFSSPVSLSLNGWGSTPSVTITAYVSTAFGHTTVTVQNCAGGGCPFSTTQVAPTTVATGAGNGTVGLTTGVFVALVNGAGAFTGADAATVTFNAVDANNTAHTASATLKISATVQTAVELALDSSAGVAFVGGANPPNFSVDFGNVDGLGASPGSAGSTRTVSSTGTLYSTPYVMTPAFSSFSSTTGTVQMYVSTNFAHTAVLQLQGSTTGAAGSYVSIPTTLASATTITSTAHSQTALTEYLGLFVFTLNGAGAFAGADSAIVTYTLVVP